MNTPDLLYTNCNAHDKCCVMPRKLGLPTSLVLCHCVKYDKLSFVVHIYNHMIIRKVLTWTFQSGIVRMVAGPGIASLILIVPTVQQERLLSCTAKTIKKNGTSPLPIFCIAICSGICEY